VGLRRTPTLRQSTKTEAPFPCPELTSASGGRGGATKPDAQDSSRDHVHDPDCGKCVYILTQEHKDKLCLGEEQMFAQGVQVFTFRSQTRRPRHLNPFEINPSPAKPPPDSLDAEYDLEGLFNSKEWPSQRSSRLPDIATSSGRRITSS
jgi:hypothetical protein